AYQPPQSDGGGSSRSVAALVAQKKAAGVDFPTTNLFSDGGSSSQVVGSRLLHLNQAAVMSLLATSPSTLTLWLPAPEPVTLDLVRVDLFTPDFTVVTSDGGAVDVNQGLHYRGIVTDDPSSLAAISIFPDEVMGLYSTQEGGNFVLSKLSGGSGGGV